MPPAAALGGVQAVMSGTPASRAVAMVISAEAMWLEALEVNPDYVAAHVNLGRLYEEVLADLQAAVRHYRAAYETSDGTELRVLPWIARLEERLQSRSPATDSNTAVGADNASQGGSAPSQQP